MSETFLDADSVKKYRKTTGAGTSVSPAVTHEHIDSVTPGSAATSLGKAEDAPHSSGDIGVFILAVRNDAGAVLAGTDLDYIPFTTDSTGALRVTGGGGGTEYTEDAAAAANPVGNASILIRSDTPATQVSTDGDNVAQRGTNYGAAFCQIVTSSGAFVDSFGGGTQYTEGDTDASITGTAALMEVAANELRPLQGTVADGLLVNLGANNDISVTSSALPTGASTAANQTTIIGHIDGLEGLLTTIDADTSALAGCVAGTEVQVDIVGALPAGTNAIGKLAANSGVDIGDVDVVSLTGSAIAHDAADSGNPHKIGFKATTSLSGLTLVANGDRTDALGGVDGVQIIRPHCNLEDIVTGQAAITDGSSTSVIAAQGAGVKTYITSVIIANTSATAVTVDLRDGTAGSVKATLPVPANTSGVVCNLPVPLPFSANTAVAADPSAAASTITVTLIGFKSKV